MARGSVLARVPLLPTTVVGSYPVPEWMERLKTEYFRGRMSHAQLLDVHEMAIKAALHDQERAGVDIVSDGELRRDNDIDYFLARLPGIEIADTAKDFYFDYYEAALRVPLPDPEALCPPGGTALRLAGDFAFTAAHTSAPVKFSFTGPFSLARPGGRGRVPRSPGPGPGHRPGAQHRGPRPGRPRGGAAADRRAVPGRLPGSGGDRGGGGQRGHRGRAGDLGAARLLRQPLCAFRGYLGLHSPIYSPTSAYGHFGRTDVDLPWERTDRAATLRDAAGLTASTVATTLR